ncbi:hypothetical protein HN51_007849 [Arachis hypogaea]
MLEEAPKMIKTAASVPCLRINSGLVKPGDVGRCVNYYVVKPGPVLDFLCENQNVKHPDFIDWTKAKSVLKNLRIKVNNLEFKISGLSNNTCRTQKDKKLG